jgi:3-oxoacyl-[acyl-carrier-protein] synthase-3
MSDQLTPSILGFGCKVPGAIRDNDDPIFTYLNRLRSYTGEQGPFYGFDTRHVLAQGEDLVSIMKPAAEEALQTAKVGQEGGPEKIDLLLGCASVSQYILPSDLYELHRRLGLPDSTLAVPLGNDFSNFNVALVLADALVRTNHAHAVLIAIGGNWTRAVDYHTVQAFSAGDGAAAVVIARPPQGSQISEWQTWHIVDKEVLAVSGNFGTMYLADIVQTERTDRLHRKVPGEVHPWQWPGQPLNELCTSPCFHITPEGFREFFKFGVNRAWEPAVNLLQRTGITSNSVTLIAHQASHALSQEWNDKIRPAYFFSTTQYYANMTVANIPVNLALALSPFKKQERDAMSLAEVSTPYVLLLAVGPDMHAHALLLGRADSSTGSD